MRHQQFFASLLLGASLCCSTAQAEKNASSAAKVRLTVTNTHPQVLEGVSVVLFREDGRHEQLCTTDSLGNCAVELSILREAGDGLLLFCKEMYFCGALKMSAPRFLEYKEHVIALAPFAIS